jgi:hypothetical protein
MKVLDRNERICPETLSGQTGRINGILTFICYNYPQVMPFVAANFVVLPLPEGG